VDCRECRFGRSPPAFQAQRYLRSEPCRPRGKLFSSGFRSGQDERLQRLAYNPIRELLLQFRTTAGDNEDTGAACI
jgi:hypothetical protein